MKGTKMGRSKQSQPQPIISIHNYAHIKGALKFINSWKMKDLNNMGLETCICVEITSLSVL